MLTPKEISDKTFDKTFGYGYRMDDVDNYLDRVASSMTELIGIKNDLEKKLEVLADKLTEYREDEESLRTALLGAQKLGDSVIRESKTKAEIIMRDATIKAEAMVNHAKRQIEREQESLTRMQKEVASFKNRLLDLYKQHLELIGALPGSTERQAAAAAAAASEPTHAPFEPPVAHQAEAVSADPLFEDMQREFEEPLPLAKQPHPDQEAMFDKEQEDDTVPPFFAEEERPALSDDEEEEDEEVADDPVSSRFGELKFGNNFKIPRNDKKSKYK